MKTELQRIPGGDSEAAYMVPIDGVVIGRVGRHKELGRNPVKSFVVSGSDYNGKTRRAKLWTAVVDCPELNEYERRATQRRITRTKTNQHDAAKHLVAAFAAAGVAIPTRRTGSLVRSYHASPLAVAN